MHQEGFDLATWVRMLAIFEAGRAALEAHIALLPERERAIVPSFFDVVTEADFVTHTLLILQHTVRNRRTVHVLCPDGSIVASLERLRGD